jgi:gamma-glutamyltranspeptidase/glutathione hydrolase
MLEHFDLRALGADSAAAAHLQIEAIKLAFADVLRHVAEPAAMQVSVAQMLDPAYLAQRARLIDPARAQRFASGLPPSAGTIYLAAADDEGRMVSFIQSNYMGFGSGVVVPGWGLSLQNRGHSFRLDAASANVVAPGKRPFHTIIPGFVTRGGRPLMSFGVMGAHMQPQGQVQTLVRMIDFQQPPQAACDAPRWRVDGGLDLGVEAQMDPAVVRSLAARGHRIVERGDSYQDFGAGQFIWCLDGPDSDGYVAASDPRRDGAAVGF